MDWIPELYACLRTAELLSTFLVCNMCVWPVFAAKNVILAGVKSVTVHDTADTGIQDLSAQFYLSKADVGRNR